MINHPAKFTDTILWAAAPFLTRARRLLDPFAGTGKVGLLKTMGVTAVIHCNELEPEWAVTAAGAPGVSVVTVGDACRLRWPDGYFDAVFTSPTYANRMADTYVDHTKRYTYTAGLGRTLHPRNSGAMKWGPAYRQLHIEAWREAHRVLEPGGLLIINVSNHIAAGKEVDVADWHYVVCLALGFDHLDTVEVVTPRNRNGANGQARTPHEYLFVFRKR